MNNLNRWDPPPATSWPAPKPDPWTDSSPIPEWQIQPEDDVPDDDDQLPEPEVYTQNLALQRLQQNAVKQTTPLAKVGVVASFTFV